MDPPAMLAALKGLERDFGRRPGRRWGDRVLDCDIVLWSGGRWQSPGLAIPHPHFRTRGFVLAPAWEITPGWRDPGSGLTLAQLTRRLTRREALPR
jgi:2-amino-4-hydroxy-6-hydroxymethyldihydropteridine diphosphokinase